MEKRYGVWAVRSGASMFGAAEAWCKENGEPVTFPTMEQAAQYAKEMNEFMRSANVHYYEKELDSVPDVEIRSAVHSNYAGMVAMVGADDKVYLGKEENYHYGDGRPARYDDRDGSLCLVSENPRMYYFLYGEGWVHTQEEMLSRGLTMEQYAEFARMRDGVLRQFEPRREILFAGQPFQPPDNYLRAAELAEEAQTGNYNMVDGQINNEPPVRPDLTDGQTHDEIRELAPETLPGAMREEKPSLVGRLKAERPEHEPRTARPPHRERGL